MQQIKILTLILAIFISAFILTSCARKEITFVDREDMPVPNVTVFVEQSNMLWINSKVFLTSDENGVINAPYMGLVNFYATKDGYSSANFNIVGNQRVKIVLLPEEVAE